MSEIEQPAHDAFQQHKDWCNECRGSYGVTETGLCATGEALWRETSVEAKRILRKIWEQGESKS